MLPEWQDDSEVSACPICKRPFTFLYRKHHCRRCGRIICDQCSPHRITIPRQYIVRNPTESLRYRLYNVDSHDGDPDIASNPALGGGETVRVCNPCVPDPNYGPPPQHVDGTQSSAAAPDTQAEEESSEARPWRTAATRRSENIRQQTYPSSTGESLQSQQDQTQAQDQAQGYAERYRPGLNVANPAERTNGANAYYSRRSASIANTPFQVPDARYRTRPNRTSSIADRYHHSPGQIAFSPTSRSFVRPGAAVSSSLPTRPVPYGSVPHSQSHSRMGNVTGETFRDPALQNQPHALRINRRATQPVREEDECPVCGTHSPPFGPDGSSTDR